MDACTMPDDLSEQLLNDAMRLPDEQRAALAAALIESLDQGVDEDAEAAWSVEIAHGFEKSKAARQVNPLACSPADDRGR